MSREQQIAKEACSYIDAVRNFRRAGEYADSVRRLGVGQLSNARDQQERDRISSENQQKILSSDQEARSRLSSSITTLNDLIKSDNEPINFEYQDEEWIIVPRNGVEEEQENFDVRRKGRGGSTSVWELY